MPATGPAAFNSLADGLRRAETEAWGHVQMLDQLLEEELSAREERRIRNALKLAAFPFIKTLDAFDFAFQPSLERARIMDLAALGFLGRNRMACLTAASVLRSTFARRVNFDCRSTNETIAC